MNIKSIKELLELMLCDWAFSLNANKLITMDELGILLKYIKNNRPWIFSSLDAFELYFFPDAYYWKMGNIKPRLEWINKHIKLN
jgi:hypothetical protein